MKIYLAHNFDARHWLLDKIVPQLTQLGHTITSRWLKESDNQFQESSAEMDLADIYKSDLFILFDDQYTGSVKPGRGKYVEFGLAYLAQRKIYVVGSSGEPYKCVFYYLKGIERFQTFEQVVSELQRLVGLNLAR